MKKQWTKQDEFFSIDKVLKSNKILEEVVEGNPEEIKFNNPPCEKCVSFSADAEKEPCINCDENYGAFKDKELELIQKAGFKLLNQSDAEIKANELIEKFYLIPDRIGDDGLFNMTKYSAIQCAIICVQEILDELKLNLRYSLFVNSFLERRISFWQEVLQILKSK